MGGLRHRANIRNHSSEHHHQPLPHPSRSRSRPRTSRRTNPRHRNQTHSLPKTHPRLPRKPQNPRSSQSHRPHPRRRDISSLRSNRGDECSIFPKPISRENVANKILTRNTQIYATLHPRRPLPKLHQNRAPKILPRYPAEAGYPNAGGNPYILNQILAKYGHPAFHDLALHQSS